MKKVSLVLVLMLGLVLAVGCGGDDEEEGGGGGSISLPVSSDTPASDMSDDEAQELCVSVYEAMEDATKSIMDAMADTLCATEGYSAAAMEAAMDGSDDDIADACETAVDECESEEVEDVEDDDAMSIDEVCEAAGAEMLAGCDAEVGLIKDCLEGVFDMMSDTTGDLDIPSCSELDADYFAEVEVPEETEPEEVDPPAACEDLVEECPELEALTGVSYK